MFRHQTLGYAILQRVYVDGVAVCDSRPRLDGVSVWVLHLGRVDLGGVEVIVVGCFVDLVELLLCFVVLRVCALLRRRRRWFGGVYGIRQKMVGLGQPHVRALGGTAWACLPVSSDGARRVGPGDNSTRAWRRCGPLAASACQVA